MKKLKKNIHCLKKKKKQADFSGPFQVLLLQHFWPKKPQAHCFECPQDKGCSTEGSWEWLGPEVVVRTLTFSDSEAMSRQTLGLWLLAKQWTKNKWTELTEFSVSVLPKKFQTTNTVYDCHLCHEVVWRGAEGNTRRIVEQQGLSVGGLLLSFPISSFSAVWGE